jgi:hypothetical protein
VEDKTCLFCNEHESIHHLFSDCVVAKVILGYIAAIFDKHIESDFESVARWWLSENNFFCSDYLFICNSLDLMVYPQ